MIAWLMRRFGKGRAHPRPRLTLDEALDKSLAHGLSAVDWGAVR